jgi:phosphonate transport system substrate-binding protein
MGKMYPVILLIVIGLILTGCGKDTDASDKTTDPNAEPEKVASSVIVLSDIDADNPIAKLERFQPLADYLAANLNEYGIGAVEVKIAPDLETMIQWMAAGEVDMYYDSPYPTMIVAEQTDAKVFLRRWKGGDPEYHSVFIARADSGLTSLDDLIGKTIAGDDAASTSGYMLPIAYLISNGFKPVEKTSPESAVADDEIGYTFSGDDENAIEWVLSGKVAASVIDNQILRDDIDEETREQIVILAETEAVPRQIVLVRPGMAPELEEVLKSLLLGLDETEEGQAILTILKTDRFDEFPEGPEAIFARVHELYEIVTESPPESSE